jgi:hypothetical protein
MISAATNTITSLVQSEYKYGFYSDIETESAPPELNEDVIRLISHKKNELEWRLKGEMFRRFGTVKRGSSLNRLRSCRIVHRFCRKQRRRLQHELSFRYDVAPVGLSFQSLAAHVLAGFRSKEDKDIGIQRLTAIANSQTASRISIRHRPSTATTRRIEMRCTEIRWQRACIFASGSVADNRCITEMLSYSRFRYFNC